MDRRKITTQYIMYVEKHKRVTVQFQTKRLSRLNTGFDCNVWTFNKKVVSS